MAVVQVGVGVKVGVENRVEKLGGILFLKAPCHEDLPPLYEVIVIHLWCPPKR